MRHDGPQGLAVDDETLDAALRAGRARVNEHGDTRYVRFVDDFSGYDRGHIVIDGRVVPLYPSIARIFALAAGVSSNFAGPLHAEEKIDGYNVRIVGANGRPLAFTRGGYVCPFATDRLADLGGFDSLLRENPELVVCGEVAGPHNPYLHGHVPHVGDDVAFFAFDLMILDETGFLSFDERDALLHRHGIRPAPQLGRFEPDDIDALVATIRQLDAQGSEGMVLKPLHAGKRVKYVTPSINLSDIVEDASLLAELPGEFFSSRIVRLAIGLEELGQRDRMPEMAERLGHALLEDFDLALRRYQETGIVSQRFEVRLRREESADALMAHMQRASKRVTVKELSRARRGGYVHLRFDKTYQQSTGWLSTVLKGAAITD